MTDAMTKSDVYRPLLNNVQHARIVYLSALRALPIELMLKESSTLLKELRSYTYVGSPNDEKLAEAIDILEAP